MENSMRGGLSSEAAKKSLETFGYNELPAAQSKHIGHIVLEVTREPMFILLLGCGSLYLLLGNYREGLSLLCWVLVIIGITFYQHRKTERALEAIRQLFVPKARVWRDHALTIVAGREVVPDDMLYIQEGDRIAADALLIEGDGLFVDESLLTGESIPVLKKISSDPSDRASMLYSGTFVSAGKGFARVIKTGVQTQVGAIGHVMETIAPQETRLQKEIKRLVQKLFVGGAFISLFITAAFWYVRGDLLRAILSGISVSMALLPEEFPVIFTVFIALGAWRMSKKMVLTRKATAIEALGTASVLCSDKTGTITQNKMKVVGLYQNGNHIEDPTLKNCTEEYVDLLKSMLYASDSHLTDPMEVAVQDFLEVNHAFFKKGTPIKEFAWTSQWFAMTRVWKFEDSHQMIAYCKGAPETVMTLCLLKEEQKKMIEKALHEFALNGYRVLAAAHCEIEFDKLPESQQDFSFTFNGLVAFEDPVREGVPQAIADCVRAGIRVIMMTGDNPITAKTIAQKIGLARAEEVMTGTELETMDEILIKEKIKTVSVFARIIPQQKLRIIELLKSTGHVVAMTGDGVNDAPALKAADIGVSMGKKGTDVAREAGALVLLDDNFTSIVTAIKLGRRIFDNLQKAMSYVIAIHIPIVGLVMIPAVFSEMPILLLPLHIVFMELIIDPVCSIAFEAEQEEVHVMSKPPRASTTKLFSFNKQLRSFTEGLLLLLLLLVVYHLSHKETDKTPVIRGVVFIALILGNVGLFLSKLSAERPFWYVFSGKNKTAIWLAIAALLVLMTVISLPFFQSIFLLEFPPANILILALIATGIFILCLEAIKKFMVYSARKKSVLDASNR